MSMSVKEYIGQHARLLETSLIKVDQVLNHQVLPDFIEQVGLEIETAMIAQGIVGATKLLTLEASGIAPTFSLAQRLRIPMIYARKGRRSTMSEPVLSELVPSRTSDKESEIVVAGENLSSSDAVFVVDDFLGSGMAAKAAANIVKNSGARLLGFAFVVEKAFETGRETLAQYDVPVISLSKLDIRDGELHIS